jgi:hypothetical protein
VALLDDKGQTVFLVAAPITEEELAAMTEAAAAPSAEPEVITAKKEEGEEGAVAVEGEAKAEGGKAAKAEPPSKAPAAGAAGKAPAAGAAGKAPAAPAGKGEAKPAGQTGASPKRRSKASEAARRCRPGQSWWWGWEIPAGSTMAHATTSAFAALDGLADKLGCSFRSQGALRGAGRRSGSR